MPGNTAAALHLLGLLSDGGVHAQQEHLYALLLAARQHGVQRVFVHAFLDGRDTLPTSGVGYLEKLQHKMEELGVGKLASAGGRYFRHGPRHALGARQKGLRRDGRHQRQPLL